MALINCPECGKQVSDVASSCPNCGYPISKKTNNTISSVTKNPTNTVNTNNRYNSSSGNKSVGIFLACLIFFGLICFIFFCIGGSNKKPSETSLKTQAWVCAQDIVKQNLKSPSTAKFCTMPEATIRNSKDNDWAVSGWVDAQNSFGGTIRTKFFVTLTLTENGYKNGYVIFDE